MERADKLPENLEQSIMGLETMPSSGHIPPELKRQCP